MSPTPLIQSLRTLKRWDILIAIVIAMVAIAVRFTNTEGFLYFITDQGRDALKLQSIVNGDLTLIGPTSGLAGFYLGPLWYYLGIPGYLLSQGSPLGISQWYIALACLSLPIWWLLTRELFPQKPVWQLVSFALLAFVPGSIAGSTFIWNPLISLPLLSLALLALIKAKESRLWLMIAFFTLGLTLQSEFAYMIFILPPLYLLIFWLRNRKSVTDYVLAAISVVVTFIPQVIFEVKNHFLMTKSLLAGILSQEGSITLLTLWQRRPAQLFNAVHELLIGRVANAQVLTVMFVALAFYGGYRAWSNRQHAWQIICVVALLPFVGFMLWRGNYGNFFPYYLTPHFIPMVLLISYGLFSFKKISVPPLLSRIQMEKWSPYAVTGITTVILTFAFFYINNTIISPDNQAGLKVIQSANLTSLQYVASDRAQIATVSAVPVTSVVATFTPNFTNDPYDFVMHWLATSRGLGVPLTQVTADTDMVYTIIEPDREIPEKRFLPWYLKVREGRVLIRKEMVGVLRLETWAKTSVASSGALPIYQEPLY